MKKMLFFAATLLVSQMTFAQTPSEVISEFQNSRGAVCEHTRTSSMSYCFNNVCWNKEYYVCGGDRLALEVRTTNYPDGSSVEKVTETIVNGF